MKITVKNRKNAHGIAAGGLALSAAVLLLSCGATSGGIKLEDIQPAEPDSVSGSPIVSDGPEVTVIGGADGPTSVNVAGELAAEASRGHTDSDINAMRQLLAQAIAAAEPETALEEPPVPSAAPTEAAPAARQPVLADVRPTVAETDIETVPVTLPASEGTAREEPAVAEIDTGTQLAADEPDAATTEETVTDSLKNNTIPDDEPESALAQTEQIPNVAAPEAEVASPEKEQVPAPVASHAEAEKSAAQQEEGLPADSTPSASLLMAEGVSLPEPAPAVTESARAHGTPSERQSVEQIVTSRSVVMPSGQYLDVVYPGGGWTYLGEADDGEKSVLSFFGRRMRADSTTFTLRSDKPGSATLHFYKNDTLTGSYIDDYLAVTVTDTKGSLQVHTRAPEYAEIVPPKPDLTRQLVAQDAESSPAQARETETAQTEDTAAQTAAAVRAEDAQPEPDTDTTAQATAAAIPASSAQDSAGFTNIQSSERAGGTTTVATPLAPNPVLSESVTQTAGSASDAGVGAGSSAPSLQARTLLEFARQAYDAQEYRKALEYVTEFLVIADLDVDKGLFLRGQILEANSEVRDIKAAIEAYSGLTSGYPFSPLWQDASNRAVYLRRFYLNQR